MRLLLVDDDTLILQSLSLALAGEPDIRIVGCATDGAAALDHCAAAAAAHLPNGTSEGSPNDNSNGATEGSPNDNSNGSSDSMPDILLMDIRMPGVDGIAATRLLKERYPWVRIMMLTTFDDRPNIQEALDAGADGYLVKTEKIAGIADKLRIMMDGTGVLGAEVLKKLTRPKNPQLDMLTPRERDIARLVAQGLTNKKIAGQLFLSEGTVRNKIVIIMEKLGVSNRTQLGRVYYDSEYEV